MLIWQLSVCRRWQASLEQPLPGDWCFLTMGTTGVVLWVYLQAKD